jgi:ubiquinone/menaquinone biosynthesis C-methylase UbiE
MSTRADKYGRRALLDPVKFHKGRSRWNQFAAAVERIGKDLRTGTILDAGCGVGHFILEGLQRGMNIWGVDPSAGKLRRYRKLIDLTGSPPDWRSRCLRADGEQLPFDADRFAAASSWYVLEHQRNPGVALREMVRVTRPGGVLAVKAQDSRRGWEGHCKIPWVPFLAGRLRQAWTEEFGVDVDKCRDVYEVTQPQVVAILESLGCTVAMQAPPPYDAVPRHWQIATEKQVRETARRIRAELEAGRWRPPPENLYVYAVKN